MCYSESTSLESVSSRGEVLVVCVSVPVVCVTAQVTNRTENVFLWNFYFTTLLLLYARNSDEKNTK